MASNSLLTVEPLCLHVLVMSASGLFKKDLFGLCDPYVKVTMKRKNKSMITEQTKKRKKTLNPEWGEKFVFKDIKLVDDSLLFEVFDENKLTRDNFLGKLHFKLSHIPIEMKKIDIMQYERSATYPLKPRSHKSRVSGSLKLKFLYYNKPPSRMGTATLMGELNLASLVEGSTGRSSPQAPGGGGAPHENAHAGGVALSPTSLSRQESTASEWMVDEDEPMPEGWQERQDANGRTFYVDHINRRTQWNRPTSSANVGANQRRAQMLADRQRMMAQTLARRNPGMTGSESQLDLTSLNGSPAGSRSSLALTTASMGMGTNSPVSPRYSVAMSTPTTNTAARSTSPNPPSVRNSIAVTTPATNADSSVPPALPPRATSVSSASIPRLPPPPSRSSANTPSAPARNNAISFQQPTSSLSRTSMATSPTPSSQQSNGDNLPEGWEMRTASNGRPFYIDHSSRKTQWHKPTAPAPSRQRLQQQQQQQPTTNPTSNGPATTPTSHTSTSASSSSTTSSSSSSAPPSDEELGPLPSGWEMRLLADGRKFFIEHATRSTQWEDPRLQAKKQQKQQQQQVSTPGTPFSRDYKLKYEQLRRHIKANHPADLPRVFEIPVRRQHLFEDSHRAIMNCKNRSHLKARLWVKFDGEKGLDYGGVSREWFFLLSHEMFNPYYGLFEYAASDNYTLQVNPESGFCNENHLEYFRFIGRILAMAIYHQRLIDGEPPPRHHTMTCYTIHTHTHTHT